MAPSAGGGGLEAELRAGPGGHGLVRADRVDRRRPRDRGLSVPPASRRTIPHGSAGFAQPVPHAVADGPLHHDQPLDPGPAHHARDGMSARRPRPVRKPVARTPVWVAPAAVVAGLALLVAVFLVIRWYVTPANNLIKPIQGSALTGPNGRPEVFYYGAEFCPYCAAQRWPLIIALSRFGTFSGLQATTSSSSDVFPNTPTFTFRNATYTSQYLDFLSVETTDRDRNPLQTPTASERQLVSSYDPGGTIPFIDVANRYAMTGAMYTPDTLGGMSLRAVADALKDPSSTQARAIIGSANLTTAAICKANADQPGTVCSSSAIQSLEKNLK
ncbi:MAG: DUF929 domain-containing protein [Chloroflexi bacterium]|nr:MAG: DUF929 domain-containing protein [Chloroflexota bacterium]